MPNPWTFQRKAFAQTLIALDKWLHLAVYFGFIAEELGANRAEIDYLIMSAPKAEIDKLLLEKMSKRARIDTTEE